MSEFNPEEYFIKGGMPCHSQDETKQMIDWQRTEIERLQHENYTIESQLIQAKQGVCGVCSFPSRDACSRERDRLTAALESAKLEIETDNRNVNALMDQVDELSKKLYSANQRAEEAEQVRQKMMDSMSAEALELKASLAETDAYAKSLAQKVVVLSREKENLQASLADKEGELRKRTSILQRITKTIFPHYSMEDIRQTDHFATLNLHVGRKMKGLEAELESLRERLRRRKYPDEKPRDGQKVIFRGSIVTYLDASNAVWEIDRKSIQDCQIGDHWLPLPTESPDTSVKPVESNPTERELLKNRGIVPLALPDTNESKKS